MINEEFNFLEDISEHANSPKKTNYTPNSNILKTSNRKINIQICNKGHNIFEFKNKINSKPDSTLPVNTQNNSKVVKSPKSNKQKNNKNIKTPDIQTKNKLAQSYKFGNKINSGNKIKYSPEKKPKLRKSVEIEKKVLITNENDYILTEPSQNFEDGANINKSLKKIVIKPKKLNLLYMNNKINSMDTKEYNNKTKKLKEQKFKKIIQDFESKEKNGQENFSLSAKKEKKVIKINNRMTNIKVNKEGKIYNDKIEGNLFDSNSVSVKGKNIKNINKPNKIESSKEKRKEEKSIRINTLKQKNELLEELGYKKINITSNEIKEKEEEQYQKKRQITEQSCKNKETVEINNLKEEEIEADNKKVEIKMNKRVINKNKDYKLKSNEKNRILKSPKKPRYIEVGNNIKSSKSSEINSCANSVKKFSSNSSQALFQKNTNKSKDKYKKFISKPIKKYNLKLNNLDLNNKIVSETIQPIKINLTEVNSNNFYNHSKSQRNKTNISNINLFMEEKEKQKEEKKSLSAKNKDKIEFKEGQIDSHFIKKCSKKKLEKNYTNYLLTSTNSKKNIIKLDNRQNISNKMLNKLSNSNSEKKDVKFKKEKNNQFKENKIDFTENLNEIIKKCNYNNNKNESTKKSNKKNLKLQPKHILLNTNEENGQQKNKEIFNTEEIKGPKLDNQKIIHSKREEKEKKKRK